MLIFNIARHQLPMSLDVQVCFVFFVYLHRDVREMYS